MTPVVRSLTQGDIPAVVALQRLCFPAPFSEEYLWTECHLIAHLMKFPEGQLVAEVNGQVVGSASAVRISEANWHAHASWEATVGGFEFDHFDADGSTLYGADISVDPRFRGMGIGRALYAARFNLVRQLGLIRYGTACRMPDFQTKAAGMSPSAYAFAVREGGHADRTLTPLLRYGLSLVTVLEDYMEDEESGNAAALLEWTP